MISACPPRPRRHFPPETRKLLGLLHDRHGDTSTSLLLAVGIGRAVASEGLLCPPDGWPNSSCFQYSSCSPATADVLMRWLDAVRGPGVVSGLRATRSDEPMRPDDEHRPHVACEPGCRVVVATHAGRADVHEARIDRIRSRGTNLDGVDLPALVAEAEEFRRCCGRAYYDTRGDLDVHMRNQGLLDLALELSRLLAADDDDEGDDEDDEDYVDDGGS